MDRKPVKQEDIWPSPDDEGKSTVTKKRKNTTPTEHTQPAKKIKTENSQNQEKKKESTKNKTPGSSVNTPAVSWRCEEIISANLGVPGWAAKNVVSLLDEGCTIPFIARYRKEQTGGMEVQTLRETLAMLGELRALESKVANAKAVIKEQGKMTPVLEQSLSNAQTVCELDCLFAPFKPGSKGTLAERARALGLEPYALKFLNESARIADASDYIDKNTKGLETAEAVVTGTKHIIADIMHKNPDVMEKIRHLSSSNQIRLQCSRTKTKKAETKPGTKAEDPDKYKNYFEFDYSISRVQPHQVLAINRGEQQKVLSVKVMLPVQVKDGIIKLCEKKWLKSYAPESSKNMISSSIEDAYNRLICPQITRAVRSNLTKVAENSSIAVFAENVKNLLLSAPLKGHTILAIDPGFTNGCKVAVISDTGQTMATDIVYIHTQRANKFTEGKKIDQLILNHKCDVVAIGNGTACREAETFIADRIQRAFPKLKYCIVDECGASIYSVSNIAIKEMPDLDPSLRSAVSLGRRLLDPLAEFVKYDPKHLGVGQYQHDMPQGQLKSSLDSTVEECVSFVGVDVNTCSECLLSRVSGLTESRAKNIITWRETFGPFICREQLLAVKGLGAKSYEQAAGFIRIHSKANTVIPTDLKEEPIKGSTKKGGKTKKKAVTEYHSNPLDMTWIHPESYSVTNRLVEAAGAKLSRLGQKDFINIIQQYINKNGINNIALQMDSNVSTITLITTALVRPLTFDLRDEFEKPLFKDSVKSMANLKVGEKVTGRVSNVTQFGAFVDIGVEKQGLVHISNMFIEKSSQRYFLKIGEKIETSIINLEIDRKRIGLKLIRIL